MVRREPISPLNRPSMGDTYRWRRLLYIKVAREHNSRARIQAALPKYQQRETLNITPVLSNFDRIEMEQHDARQFQINVYFCRRYFGNNDCKKILVNHM